MKLNKAIPWWKPQIGPQEKKFINQVLANHFPNEGKFTELFEQKISNLLHCKYVVTVTSGTAAIYLALKAIGIRNGDEVIVPNITFIATANAVEMCGAKPVLVDIDPKTMNIDPQAFSKSITKKTKAVIVVHVSGRAAAMKEILLIAKKNNVDVIEDAAEAFMSKHKEKYLGTFGQVGCFSFSAHKTITTGQGGVIITNNKKIYQRLKELKDQGRPHRGTGGDDKHNVIGYNFKFTDLQAAVGLGQLSYLASRLKRMKRTHQLYRRHLINIDEFSLFDFDIAGGEVPQWTDAIVKERDQLDIFLKSKGIFCRKYWFPIHTQIPYRLSGKNLYQSTRLSSEALWLPSAFTMTDNDVLIVCNAIKKFFKKNDR